MGTAHREPKVMRWAVPTLRIRSASPDVSTIRLLESGSQMERDTRWLTSLACGGLSVLLAGCSASLPPQPVRGKVFFQGKPAEGAVVTFVSRNGNDAKGQRYAGIVATDGTFKLSARAAFDGAPVGHYAVTVFYLSPDRKVDGQNAGPDLLKGKYADPATTPLNVEIKPGDNNLAPFHLN